MNLKKVVFLLSISVLLIALVVCYEVKQFQPRKMIVDRDAVISVSVSYHGSKINVDKEKLISILDHYYAKKTTYDYFPYLSEKIDITIDFVENHRPRHILLGEFNVWYESSDKGAYDILEVQKLKGELKSIIKESFR